MGLYLNSATDWPKYPLIPQATSDAIGTHVGVSDTFTNISSGLIISQMILNRNKRKNEPVETASGTVTGYFDPIILNAESPTIPDHGGKLLDLRLAAEAGDEAAFLEGAREINWLASSPSDYIDAIQLALLAGAHLVARNLASKGARIYPGDERLGKVARLLAPPTFVKCSPTQSPALNANQSWLSEHVHEYSGQWVVLKDGELVAFSDNVAELTALFSFTEDIMITRV